MDGVIFILGFSLMIVNGLTTGQFGRLWSIVSNPSTSGSNSITNERNDALAFIGELVLIFTLVEVSRISPSAAGTSVSLLAILWILWGINNPGAFSNLFESLSGNYHALNANTSGGSVENLGPSIGLAGGAGQLLGNSA